MEVTAEVPNHDYSLPNTGTLSISEPPAAPPPQPDIPAQVQVPPVVPTSSPPESPRESPRSELSALNALAAATRSDSVGLGGTDPLDLSASGPHAPARPPSSASRSGRSVPSDGLQLSLPHEQLPHANLSFGGDVAAAPQLQAQPPPPPAAAAALDAPSRPYMNSIQMSVQPAIDPRSAGIGAAGPLLEPQVALQAPAPPFEAHVRAPQPELLNGQVGVGLQQQLLLPQINAAPNEARPVGAQLNALQVGAQLNAPQVSAPRVEAAAAGAELQERHSSEKKKGKVLGLFGRKHKEKDKGEKRQKGARAAAQVSEFTYAPPKAGLAISPPAVGVDGPAAGGFGVNAPTPSVGWQPSAPVQLSTGFAGFSSSAIPMPAQTQANARAGVYSTAQYIQYNTSTKHYTP